MSRAQMPMPLRQRGSSGGHSVGDVQVFEQRMVSEPSTQSELSQSSSLVHTDPGSPVPRGPGMQYTSPPSEWHRVPAGQSSLLKHGHSFGTVQTLAASLETGPSLGEGELSLPHAAMQQAADNAHTRRAGTNMVPNMSRKRRGA
ncbi:MAG: hypothetical protein H0V17_18850 [Deltaproteobacteria bacterium]|nr:hypothetical protein [Deltaproteobacteria bacterium]